MAASAGEKTEKATPKRRDEARKEGRVAKSAEVNTAAALVAGFAILALRGGRIWDAMAQELGTTLRDPQLKYATPTGVFDLFAHCVDLFARAVGPVFAVMVVTAVVANVAQVKLRLTPAAIKPKWSKLNPINGAKQMFSPSSLVELAKNVAKLVVVLLPASAIVWRRREELLALGGADPMVAGRVAVGLVTQVGFVVAVVYTLIGVGDWFFQRHRFEKGLKMTKQEVKMEMRQADIAPEIKAAQRRRQREAARRRMLQDVATADVVITNPTHVSVALKYDPANGAPTVVAKGVDLLAARIRELADDAGVPRVENVALARTLYAQVEVGHTIPAELFAAVAEVLAYVFQAQQRARRSGLGPRVAA